MMTTLNLTIEDRKMLKELLLEISKNMDQKCTDLDVQHHFIKLMNQIECDVPNNYEMETNEALMLLDIVGGYYNYITHQRPMFPSCYKMKSSATQLVSSLIIIFLYDKLKAIVESHVKIAMM